MQFVQPHTICYDLLPQDHLSRMGRSSRPASPRRHEVDMTANGKDFRLPVPTNAMWRFRIAFVQIRLPVTSWPTSYILWPVE